eukprot:13317838-Alexandrium_andersonii.AAC.1
MSIMIVMIFAEAVGNTLPPWTHDKRRMTHRGTGPNRASGERNGEATEGDHKDNGRSDPRAEARPLSCTREASPPAVGGSIQPS